MLIKQVYLEDKHYEGSGYSIEITTETKTKKLRFIDGEPEDATINRDFSHVHQIDTLVRMAYEAGKNGEPLETLSVEIEDVEDFF